MADRTFRIQTPEGLRAAFTSAWSLAKELMKSGDGYELVIRKLKSRRSLEQNRRYHALLRDLSAVAWLGGRQYAPDAWAEFCKQSFIGWEDLPGGGKRGMSTTKLSIQEFGDYMTQIEAWAAGQGWPLMEQAA